MMSESDLIISLDKQRDKIKTLEAQVEVMERELINKDKDILNLDSTIDYLREIELTQANERIDILEKWLLPWITGNLEDCPVCGVHYPTVNGHKENCELENALKGNAQKDST